MLDDDREPVLRADAWITVRGKPLATFGAGHHGIDDPAALIGHPVVIDDVRYRVTGVEMFERLPRDGRLDEPIGLLVEPDPD